MSHRLAYLLCATPRSGTTMLCDLLSASEEAGRPQSYYRRQDIEARAKAWGLQLTDFVDRREFDRAYLELVLRAGAGDTGVFGLRLMWGTLIEMVERLAPLHPSASVSALFEIIFGPLVYVHVSRSDKVAQAISLLKAEQSGLWHLTADGLDRQRTARGTTPRYDGGRIAELLAELERDDTAWDDFFAEHAIEPVRIKYEPLAASPQEEVGKVLVALGSRPELGAGLPVQTSKMANVESVAWAERFRREQDRPGDQPSV